MQAPEHIPCYGLKNYEVKRISKVKKKTKTNYDKNILNLIPNTKYEKPTKYTRQKFQQIFILITYGNMNNVMVQNHVLNWC